MSEISSITERLRAPITALQVQRQTEIQRQSAQEQAHSQDPVLGKLPYAGPACSDPVRAAKVLEKRVRNADMLAQAYAIQAINPAIQGVNLLEDVWAVNMVQCHPSNRGCKKASINAPAKSLTWQNPRSHWKNSDWEKAVGTMCERAAELEFQAVQRLLEKMNVQIKLDTAEGVSQQTERIQAGQAPAQTAQSSNNLLYVGIGLVVLSAALAYIIYKRRQ